jgi:HAD superfamily hydrolase (TIGR01509 family)
MPFAHELLQKVKQQSLEIYLVTGSGQASLLDGLQQHFPGIFVKERMITAFDVQHGKPHPEPYLKALQKSGLSPAEVVVVENAPLGVESAKAAGLFVLAINTGPLNENVLWESGADVVLTGMEALYENWEKFGEK